MIQMIIQRRKQKMNLNHMKELHKEGIRILDTSMMARNIMMPKMNGYQATKAIRTMSGERPDAATIPIIAQSANAFKEDIQASLDSGMNGHISKPFNMDEVSVSIMRNLI